MGILTLLLASPALSRLLVYPRTEFFTELWVLGSNHTAENYPFNVTGNQNYTVFLGIGNHLGYSAYYVVEVKFRNQTQSAPSSLNRTSSSLPSLFNITAFATDEGIWELPLVFAFDYEYDAILQKVEFHSLRLNSALVDLSNNSAIWDSKKNGFFNNLFFELWIYNRATNSFHYHERFVSVWLNMTK
jgi:hypothetical protein